MNANELADELERLYQQDIIDGVADLAMPEAATMLRQQQAEIEALKETNGQFADLIQSLREELNKTRQEVLMWENAEVPPETMADIIEELERRGFITK